MSCDSELSVRQKAALTRKRRAAALTASQTRKRMSAIAKARAAEAASNEALRAYCEQRGWRLAFFEGQTGAPRTGLIDAVAFPPGRTNADALDIRLIQLKGGNAGVCGQEIARLKRALRVPRSIGWWSNSMGTSCTYCLESWRIKADERRNDSHR